MLATTRELIREIADRHGVDPDKVILRYGGADMMPARKAIASELMSRGYTVTKIAGVMKRDRHTIYYWLGKPRRNADA